MNYQTNLVPSTLIAKRYEISRYMARKVLRALVEEGIVESGCDSWYDTYSESQILIRGYKVSGTGKETITYREVEEMEAKLIKECFGI